MRDDRTRTASYAKDSAYEALLQRVNAEIAGVDCFPDAADAPARPCVFITGQPRCGTTLFYQVLAASGAFGYVTNLNARFFANPAFGAHVQNVVAPFLPRDPFCFRSRGGITDAWKEPHEFGYFWERHFPLDGHHQPSERQLAGVDIPAFLRDLAALEATLGKPLLFKNLVLDFILPFVASALPHARFARIRRPPMVVARSIYKMRREFYGSDQAWFSIRPADADALLDAPPAVQIAHQLATIDAALDSALAKIGADRWLDVSYRELCEHPREVARRVVAFAGLDPDAVDDDELPPGFPVSDGPALDPATEAALAAALRDRGLER